jgi:DeoR/GlpR family transcriptional regulator of sugar metabolism
MLEKKIQKKDELKCLSTISGRLIFSLLSCKKIWTRKELLLLTGFSDTTISRYISKFAKARLIIQAPGIIFLSKIGERIFVKNSHQLEDDLKIAKQLFNRNNENEINVESVKLLTN